MMRIVSTLLISLLFISCSEMKSGEDESGGGLSALMLRVQSHHSKLYLALEGQNKDLASYIVHELEEHFEELENVHNIHDGVQLGGIAKKTIWPALHELEVAMESYDSSIVFQKFENLTLMCNKCHKASGHSFIRIKKPDANNFPNQEFRKP